VLAIRSAQDSGRSADAAEKTAKAAREEADQSRELVEIARQQHTMLLEERQRRPVLAVDLEIDTTMEAVSGGVPVVFKAIFRNGGEKAADGALVTVFAPRDIHFFPCTAGGGMGQRVDLVDVPDELTSHGTTEPSHVHAWRIDPLPQARTRPGSAPLDGLYELRIRLEHQDAEKKADRRFAVVVKGDDVQLSPRRLTAVHPAISRAPRLLSLVHGDTGSR
jgi:hypothetical protein